MRVLVVEDEVRLADALVQILAKNKITADAVYDGADGLDNALTGIYDVIVLDIMLPKMDGIEVLRNVRKNNISSSVLLLTAKDDISDKVKGLDSGADDYLTKPFATEELLARIRALGRRNAADVVCDDRISFEDISLNLSTYELECDGSSVKLGLKEYSIAELLIRNGTKIVTKESMLLKVWGYDSDAEYNNVEVYISFLRKKLSFIKSKTTVKTVRGVGYCLESK